MKTISVYLATLFVCATVLGLNQVHAQTQATTGKGKNRNQQTASELRLDKLLAQARPIRGAGLSLTAMGGNGDSRASGFTITPTGVNLRPVVGGSIEEMIETALGGVKFPNGALQPASAKAAPLFTVAHDETLQGDGTNGSPLGIKVPLVLHGSLAVDGVIQAAPSSGNAVEASGGVNANGVNANGGKGQNRQGGIGVRAFGGDGGIGDLGGIGVLGAGGDSVQGSAGAGVKGEGGNSESNRGGTGVQASGGRSKSFRGGTGVEVTGGESENGQGGTGLEVTGGVASGNVNVSGAGIVARPGTAFNGAEKGFAGDFIGNVQVSGNLSKGGGSFKIDHPLDPANKYLYHSFVESPDMMNIYNGNITTDANGDALVELPQYFGALNRDFRYQLTVIGAFAQAIVAEKVNNNHFRIKTNSPNIEVSWQVTGIRQDAFANKNRIPVEQDKTEQERGLYLHPDAFDQPEEKSVLMVQHPEMLRQKKDAREMVQKEKQ